MMNNDYALGLSPAAGRLGSRLRAEGWPATSTSITITSTSTSTTSTTSTTSINSINSITRITILLTTTIPWTP